MQCPACRHENPAQAKFCLECGARLVVSCSNCRTELPPSAKFCLECGERVTPSGAAMVSPSASPEAYTPKHLAARMEQAARPGAVPIALATLDLVEGFVAVKSLGPVPVKGRRAARAHTVRRPGRRDRGAPPRARAHRCRTRAGGRHRGRGRRGEIPPRLGVHAVAPHPRLAGARKRLGLL